MGRTINQLGLDHLKKWEGLRTTAYKDIAGVWTIGYGHTAAAGEPIPILGMKISTTEAEEILKRDLVQYEQAVQDLVVVPLNDNQYAALVSFIYNIGIVAFQHSTLLKKLNQGNYDAVPTELMKWVNSAGKRIQGLVNRRAAEAGLWVKGDFVASAYIDTATQNINFKTKPEVIGPLIGTVSGLTGFAAGSGPFQWALAAMMVAGCAIGVGYFVKRRRDELA